MLRAYKLVNTHQSAIYEICSCHAYIRIYLSFHRSGEFTPENQMKLKSDAEKEKVKLDPWKLKYFEPIWGSKSLAMGSVEAGTESDRSPLKTTIKLTPDASTSMATTTIPSSNYITSSGRTVKNPGASMAVGAPAAKRSRGGGTTTRASSLSTSANENDNSSKVMLRTIHKLQLTK